MDLYDLISAVNSVGATPRIFHAGPTIELGGGGSNDSMPTHSCSLQRDKNYLQVTTITSLRVAA